MKIEAIRNLESESQRQVAEWTYLHIAALSRAQARYLTLSLVSVIIGMAYAAEQPATVGLGEFSVTREFFVYWFPVVLCAIAWGLMGSLAQTAHAWPRLLELLNLKQDDLGLFDIDPKPSFADHVMFLPDQLKSRILGIPLKFVSGFFYDLGYWVPIALGWYMYFGLLPDPSVDLGTKLRASASIVFLIASIPATFFAFRTIWRRHVRKWVDWICSKRKEFVTRAKQNES